MFGFIQEFEHSAPHPKLGPSVGGPFPCSFHQVHQGDKICCLGVSSSVSARAVAELSVAPPALSTNVSRASSGALCSPWLRGPPGCCWCREELVESEREAQQFQQAGSWAVSRAVSHSCSAGSSSHFLLGPAARSVSVFLNLFAVTGATSPNSERSCKPHILLPEHSQTDFCAHLCVRDVWRVFVLLGGKSPGDSQTGLQFCRRMGGRAQISLLWLHQSENIYQY